MRRQASLIVSMLLLACSLLSSVSFANAQGFDAKVHVHWNIPKLYPGEVANATVTVENIGSKTFQLYSIVFVFDWGEERVNFEEPIEVKPGEHVAPSIVVPFKPYAPSGVHKFSLILWVHDEKGIGNYALHKIPSKDVFYLEPYRTMNLTIVSWSGTPLPEGILVIQSRFTGEEWLYPIVNGTAEVKRLRDYYGNLPSTKDEFVLYVRQVSLYDGVERSFYVGKFLPEGLGRASLTQKFKIPLYDVSIKILDYDGKPTNAPVILKINKVSSVAVNGTAVFPSMPEGKFHVKAYYQDVEIGECDICVCKKPGKTIPETNFSMETKIRDVRVEVHDPRGRLVNASIFLKGRYAAYAANSTETIYGLIPGKYSVEIYAWDVLGVKKKVYEGTLNATTPPKELKYVVPLYYIEVEGLKPGEKIELVVDGLAFMNETKVIAGPFHSGMHNVTVVWRGMMVVNQTIALNKDVKITPESILSTLTVKVVDTAGEPIRANITLVKGNETWSVSGNHTAIFKGLLRGNYTIIILYNSSFTGETFNATFANISIPRPTPLKAVVPLHKVIIEARWSNGSILKPIMIRLANVTKSSGDGRVVFEQVPTGNYSVTVFYRSSPLLMRAIEISNSSEKVLKIITGDLIVYVSDLLGKPVKGAEVSIRLYNLRYGGKTDGQGKIIFKDIVPGTYAYVVQVAGWKKEGKVNVPGKLAITVPTISLLGMSISPEILLVIAGVVVAIIVVFIIVARKVEKGVSVEIRPKVLPKASP